MPYNLSQFSLHNLHAFTQHAKHGLCGVSLLNGIDNKAVEMS